MRAGAAYRLNVGGALVWVEEVRPYPTGALGVHLPVQHPDAYVGGIPGFTKKKPLGLALGDEVELDGFNLQFVRDLPRLRREGIAEVPPPRMSEAGRGRAAKRVSPGRSPRAARRYSLVKPNPAFRPGTQSGLVQSALQSLDKPTKQEIADACAKSPEWKWSADAAFKGARWYVDVLVREGFAKEIE